MKMRHGEFGDRHTIYECVKWDAELNGLDWFITQKTTISKQFKPDNNMGGRFLLNRP